MFSLNKNVHEHIRIIKTHSVEKAHGKEMLICSSYESLWRAEKEPNAFRYLVQNMPTTLAYNATRSPISFELGS